MIRPGDKVRVTLPRDALDKEKKGMLRRLATQGATVEVMVLSNTVDRPRIVEAEDLGPVELFEKYAAMNGMSLAAVQKGKDLLLSLTLLLRRSRGGAATGATPSTTTTPTIPSPLPQNLHHHSGHVSLQFESVEVEGYFSFRDIQHYNLSNRGLVVVTGQVHQQPPSFLHEDHQSRLSAISTTNTEDKTVSKTSSSLPHHHKDDDRTMTSKRESNGAGKTALVMAPLWALTGHLDARTDGSGVNNVDIIHDGSKMARVKVQGRVNGVPFVVERRVVRRGKGGGLFFELNGNDKTMQEIRLTQALIDNVLGAPLLGRAVFYGQNEITGLLDSTDRAFKAELGKIVDLDVWRDAKEASRKELNALRGALVEKMQEQEMRQRYAAQFEQELENSQRAQQVQEEERACRLNELMLEKERMERNVVAPAVDSLKQTISKVMSDIVVMDDDSESSEAEDAALLAEAQRRTGAALALATSRERTLMEYSALLERKEDAVLCDRCYQSIDAVQHRATLERLQGEYDEARVEVQRAQQHVEDVEAAVTTRIGMRRAYRELDEIVRYAVVGVGGNRVGQGGERVSFSSCLDDFEGSGGGGGMRMDSTTNQKVMHCVSV